MAEAMFGGLVAQGHVVPDQVVASGPREARSAELNAKYGIQTTLSNREAVDGADVVVLSIKPQMATAVLKELSRNIPPHAVLVSIVAGQTLRHLADGLQHKAVVRAMPNTPGKIGEGITVWTPAAEVGEAGLEQTRALLSALGKEEMVDHERYLDMATALSGTGPMYVFLFMEALVDAGVRMGLPRYLATKLVLQTTRGSADYAEATGVHFAQLRNDVTSPAGTSAEALYRLDEAGFRTALAKGVEAAYRRSLELGG